MSETILDTPPPRRLFLHPPKPYGWLPDGWAGWSLGERAQWLADRGLVMYRGILIAAELRDDDRIRRFIDEREDRTDV